MSPRTSLGKCRNFGAHLHREVSSAWPPSWARIRYIPRDFLHVRCWRMTKSWRPGLCVTRAAGTLDRIPHNPRFLQHHNILFLIRRQSHLFKTAKSREQSPWTIQKTFCRLSRLSIPFLCHPPKYGLWGLGRQPSKIALLSWNINDGRKALPQIAYRSRPSWRSFASVTQLSSGQSPYQ